MKKVMVIAILAVLFLNIPAVVFAKGGGFGSLMRERIEQAYDAGYKEGYAAAFKPLAIVSMPAASIPVAGVIFGIGIGAAIGYVVARRKFKSH